MKAQRPAVRRPRRLRGDASGESGFVLTWLAIMLVVLVAFAGVSVDVGNWYFVGHKALKAADSASLAGAVFLPDEVAEGKSIATTTAEANGFSAARGDTVTADQEGLLPNQLRVTIKTPVTNFFLGLLGIDRTTITRSAVAEFQGPVPMGSPDNRLGKDPETGHDPQFWINVAGANATKVSGDRFTANTCGSTGWASNVANCSNSNTEYDARGYAFIVRVDGPVLPGKDLSVQVFDPLFAYEGDNCAAGRVTFPSSADLDALQTLGDGAPGRPVPAGYYDRGGTSGTDNRYAAGQNSFCSGDQDIVGRDMVTTFIVRKPDLTPFDDFDNPVAIDSSGKPCVVQAAARDLQNAPSGETGSRVTKLLTPGDGAFSDAEAVVNPSNNFDATATGLSFAEGFRRWVSMCNIASGSVTTGDYVLQIKTSAELGDPFGTSSPPRGGHNRMSLRAGYGSGIATPNPLGIGFFGDGRLPIYANDTGASSTFYVARLLPSGGDRVLKVTLYDIGDVAAGTTGTLTLLGPDGAAWAPPGGCRFTFRQDKTSVTDPNCQLSNVSSNIRFQGQLVDVEAPIPSTYNCAVPNRFDCWFKIRAAFPGGVTDTTTWQAQVLGDPVHLIE